MKLIERINENLKKNNLNPEMDQAGDKSCSWIEMKKGDIQIVIHFDGKGQNIESINAYKDVVQVVDQVKLF